MSSGLIPSNQTRPNTKDDYFVRKGEELIVPTPLTIVSEDGTKLSSVGTGNDANMYLISDAGDVVVGTNATVGGAVLEINGTSGLGRVYDDVYNLPPTSTPVITALQAETTGNVTYDSTATLDAGTYQLMLMIETPVPAVGTQLAMRASNPPSTSVINYSGSEAVAASTGTNFLTLNSGYFVHPGGSIRIQVSSSGAAWTGTWALQLVKIA